MIPAGDIFQPGCGEREVPLNMSEPLGMICTTRDGTDYASTRGTLMSKA